MEFMFRIWLNLAKSKMQQKTFFYFNFRTQIHYDLPVAFWKILELAYKDDAYNLCEEIAWTDKQTCKSRKQSCKELWELRPKHWCRLAESWVSQHAWRAAVHILCVIWEPRVTSVIRGIPCWFHLSLPYQNNFYAACPTVSAIQSSISLLSFDFPF